MSHARLSPSSAHRWCLCPGSPREEAKYPEDTGGPAAIDGTHSHTLLEYCVKNNLSDPHAMIDKELVDHYGSFIVDAERAARVAVAIDYLKLRKEELGKVAIRSEERVDPGKWLARDDVDGTADVQVIADDSIEIIDYKDGMTPVRARGNKQLMLYGLGALMPYQKEGYAFPFQTVRLTIIQPKVSVKGCPPITSHDYDLLDLLNEGTELRGLAARTDEPDAQLVPGEEQCKWCKAKGNCSALANKALQEAQVMFAQMDMATQSANNEPTELSDDKILQIVEATPLVREFLQAVENEAMRRFETGHAVPGLKLVRGRGSRGWNLTDEELEKKLKAMGVPKASIYNQKIVSPAQLAKLSWEKKGEKHSLSERQMKRVEDNYIEKKQGRLTLALDSDSRTAVVTDAAALFKDVKPETVAPEQPALPNWMIAK